MHSAKHLGTRECSILSFLTQDVAICPHFAHVHSKFRSLYQDADGAKNANFVVANFVETEGYLSSPSSHCHFGYRPGCVLLDKFIQSCRIN